MAAITCPVSHTAHSAPVEAGTMGDLGCADHQGRSGKTTVPSPGSHAIRSNRAADMLIQNGGLASSSLSDALENASGDTG